MTIEVKVVADSISVCGQRLTTLQLVYPRFVHAEFMTHRVFSRNASSSRAIPVAKMIEQVRTNPAMPIHWGKNQPGMQANEQLDGVGLDKAKHAWMMAARQAADTAEYMNIIGLHKQVANRILEPFQHIHVIVTATEWDNFFALRCHPDAQPEIRELADRMAEAIDTSQPKLLEPGEWHLPYVTDADLSAFGPVQTYLRGGEGGMQAWNDEMKIDLCRKISAARCARVSYLTHDGQQPDIEKDLALYDRLVGSVPLHASPIEHQATPDQFVEQYSGNADDMPDVDEYWDKPGLHGNFVGWIQYRKLIEESFK